MSPTELRTVHCTDAIQWLNDSPRLTNCSIVTSLPDYSEFPQYSIDQWKSWFIDTAALVMSRCPDEGVSIFYQTDLKKDGIWIDKSFLIQTAAEKMGHSLLWHKFVCRTPPSSVTFGRPGYSHLLCFSKSLRLDIKNSITDVLPHPGSTTWTRGMGIDACLFACRFVLNQTSTRTIIDPFCGHGTVLAAANSLGLNAIGVEIGKKRAKKSALLSLSELES